LRSARRSGQAACLADETLNQSARVSKINEPAKVFEDRAISGDWRVEWFDDDDGCEVTIFSASNAREQAIRYADRQYGSFEEVSLSPYPWGS